MKSKKSYLDRLKFDDKLTGTPIAFYLTNYRYVFLLIIAIVASGLFSFINLPRRLNPEVKIPIVSVSTTLPGASPQDMESLITIPLENEISGLEKVNTITSTSVDSFSQIAIEFQSSVDPDRAKDSVQSAVDSVNTLPDEAQQPDVQKLDFENQPIWTFIVTGNKDSASLITFGQTIKENLESVSSIKHISITGIEEQEIQVLIDPNTQTTFGIDPISIARQIHSSLNSQPAGIVNTPSSSIALTIDPTTTSVEELRDMHLNLNGQIVPLGDVATIMIRPKPNQNKAYYASNTQEATEAITFSVFKADNVNIDKAVKDAQAETQKTLSNYKDQFKLLTVLDLSNEVDKQFSHLLTSFRDTMILVIAVLFIFLGARQALVVALAIPLSFLIAFTVMQILGLTLNFLSLFSLILALGLLVDDAIVIVAATTSYWKSKRFTPNETGLLVLRDFFIPIWSTTITAVWAFLPILIASGIIGEFIKSISIVVSATLLASTAVAILITLPTMMLLLKPNFPNRVRILFWLLVFLTLFALLVTIFKTSPILPLNIGALALFIAVSFILRSELKDRINEFFRVRPQVNKTLLKVKTYTAHGIIDSTKIAKYYEKIISKVLQSKSARNKTLVIVAIFALFSYSLLPLGFVANEFFPRTDQNSLYVSVELPSGTNLQSTTEEAKKLTSDLRKTDGIDYITTQTGRSASGENFFAPQGATNNILLTIVLPDEEKRRKNSIQIAQELREKYENYYRGKISVVEQSSGPPAGADIQIKYLGEDPKLLNQYADRTISYLQTREGITNVQKSIKPGSGKIVFVPDKNKLALYGTTEQEIGFQLRTYASGFTLDTDVNFDGLEKDITFRTTSSLQSPESLASVVINTPSGQFPLSSLGTLEFKSTSTQITREDRKRTISTTAAVTQSKNIAIENKGLEKFANDLNLEQGYSWKTGGVNEENQKSVNSILQAMIIAFILITTTMVLQFGSYRKAFIILLKIPLAISGVFIIFALTATPLSFPTLIGILALFGITVYQSMLIVDKINKNLKEGLDLKHAISEASASRVEPIMFGTITTVVGLIPITLSDPLWRGLGGAIIAGLLFSGIIMLFFIPVIYYKMYEKEIK